MVCVRKRNELVGHFLLGKSSKFAKKGSQSWWVKFKSSKLVAIEQLVKFGDDDGMEVPRNFLVQSDQEMYLIYCYNNVLRKKNTLVKYIAYLSFHQCYNQSEAWASSKENLFIYLHYLCYLHKQCSSKKYVLCSFIVPYVKFYLYSKNALM